MTKSDPTMNDAVDPNAPTTNTDGTPLVTANDGEVKVTKLGEIYQLEARKGDTAYLIRGDDEKALRAYFKANPEKCIAGQ
jgi:hypothetical protein